MNHNVDMTLEKAQFCPNCDVVTTASPACMRCTGQTYPLRRWFVRTQPTQEPETAEPTCVTYKIKRGRTDEEDQAVYCEDADDMFPNRFLSQAAATDEIFMAVQRSDVWRSARMIPASDMFNRLSGVVATFEIESSVGTSVWCVVQIMPKIIQQSA